MVARDMDAMDYMDEMDTAARPARAFFFNYLVSWYSCSVLTAQMLSL